MQPYPISLKDADADSKSQLPSKTQLSIDLIDKLPRFIWPFPI